MRRRNILFAFALLGILIVALVFIVLNVVNTDKDTAEKHFNQGQKLADEGRYDDAIVEFGKAIELDPNIELGPNYAAAYSKRGSAYTYEGQYDLAIADYNKAIELDPNIELGPDYAVAYYNRGSAYTYKRKYDLAIADFNKVIELSQDPDLVDKAQTQIDKLNK